MPELRAGRVREIAERHGEQLCKRGTPACEECPVARECPYPSAR